jgi:hypothetical protein
VSTFVRRKCGKEKTRQIGEEFGNYKFRRWNQGHGYRKVTERDRKHHIAATTANQKFIEKNTTSKAIKKQTPSPLLLFSLKKTPPKIPRIPRKISQTSPLRHLNPRLRTPQTTPRNHHLHTPSLNSALQHILEIVLVDLFPVVDPAVDWVREIDTDLVGCVFRVMILGGAWEKGGAVEGDAGGKRTLGEGGCRAGGRVGLFLFE